MPKATRMPKTTRLSALIILFMAAFPAAAQTIDESFVVEKGTLVRGCGGFDGGCRDYMLRGELGLRLDPAAASAFILGNTLEIAEPGDEFRRLGLPVDDLVGTIEDEVIRFVSVPEGYTTFDWTLTRSDGGIVLQGLYDEGCCDLYAFDFRNVSFDEQAVLEPSTMLLLGGGRFGVEVRYETFAGSRGAGKAIEQGSDSGYFWFFDADNTEVVVKLIDACASFDRFWFFAAGLTNLEVEIVVTDFQTGATRVYDNPMSQKFETILDVDAFATCD